MPLPVLRSHTPGRRPRNRNPGLKKRSVRKVKLANHPRSSQGTGNPKAGRNRTTHNTTTSPALVGAGEACRSAPPPRAEPSPPRAAALGASRPPARATTSAPRRAWPPTLPPPPAPPCAGPANAPRPATSRRAPAAEGCGGRGVQVWRGAKAVQMYRDQRTSPLRSCGKASLAVKKPGSKLQQKPSLPCSERQHASADLHAARALVVKSTPSHVACAAAALRSHCGALSSSSSSARAPVP